MKFIDLTLIVVIRSIFDQIKLFYWMISLLIVAASASDRVLVKDQTAFYSSEIGKNTDFYAESGHITFDDQSALFYQLFLKSGRSSLNEILKEDILILWLEGGPGCSSQSSSFTQHGPFLVDEQMKVQLRDVSWNKKAHLLYIDQPFGTGFSYSKANVTNSKEAAKFLVEGLREFFNLHTIFQQTPFYIVGESYAGHYIPVTAAELFKDGLASQINYKGIMIGGAWTVPRKQLTQIPGLLFNLGMVDQFRVPTLHTYASESLEHIDKEEYAEFLEVSDELILGEGFLGPNFRYNFQIYDYDEREKHQEFLNAKREQFQAKVAFEECNQIVYKNFAADQAMSVEDDLVFLIEKGKVLIFNGQFDTVISLPGAVEWINQMKWKDLYEWKRSPKQVLLTNGESFGTIKAYGNFAYVTLYKAGHMSAADNPEFTLALLDKFINN